MALTLPPASAGAMQAGQWIDYAPTGPWPVQRHVPTGVCAMSRTVNGVRIMFRMDHARRLKLFVAWRPDQTGWQTRRSVFLVGFGIETQTFFTTLEFAEGGLESRRGLEADAVAALYSGRAITFRPGSMPMTEIPLDGAGMAIERLYDCVYGSASPAQRTLPPGQHEYVVFFDENGAALSPVGVITLIRLIRDYGGMGHAPVRITAHSDRPDPPEAAIALSARYASAVRDQLVAYGIPAGVISVETFGATRPVVQAPAGTRAARNRHVVITVGTR